MYLYVSHTNPPLENLCVFFSVAMIAAKLGAVLLLVSGLEAEPNPAPVPAPEPAPYFYFTGPGASVDPYALAPPALVPQFMLAPPVNPPPFNPYPFSGGLDYGLLPAGQNFMRAQGGCIHSCGWGKKK